MRSTCEYCGQTADTRDHVIPRAHRHSLESAGLSWDLSIPDTVPACRECNILAQAGVWSSLEEKRLAIQDKLRSKYRRTLQTPDLDSEELADLKGSLKKHIQKELLNKQIIQERVSWMS
jgi:hypothetical protein